MSKVGIWLLYFSDKGLTDCEDPKCCENPVCRKSQLCLTHTIVDWALLGYRITPKITSDYFKKKFLPKTSAHFRSLDTHIEGKHFKYSGHFNGFRI